MVLYIFLRKRGGIPLDCGPLAAPPVSSLEPVGIGTDIYLATDMGHTGFSHTVNSPMFPKWHSGQ